MPLNILQVRTLIQINILMKILQNVLYNLNLTYIKIFI